MNTSKHSLIAGISVVLLISCADNKAGTTANTAKDTTTQTTSAVESKPSTADVQDGPAIATIETSDYILKIHRAIPFQLKPKSYEPIKVDPSTKLVVLDVSVRNKLSTPINFSRILGMTVLKGKGEKNLMAPWVVGAYEVDYPEAKHQKEYDALWSENFEANGFHRSILLGLNPEKGEKNFRLIVPEKPDFNNPSRKEVQFTTD